MDYRHQRKNGNKLVLKSSKWSLCKIYKNTQTKLIKLKNILNQSISLTRKLSENNKPDRI